jgi:hypothetical protein
VKRLYALAFQRAPTRRELAAAREFLKQTPVPPPVEPVTDEPKSGNKKVPKEPPKPLGPWEQYAQVLLAANEFAFVD